MKQLYIFLFLWLPWAAVAQRHGMEATLNAPTEAVARTGKQLRQYQRQQKKWLKKHLRKTGQLKKYRGKLDQLLETPEGAEASVQQKLQKLENAQGILQKLESHTGGGDLSAKAGDLGEHLSIGEIQQLQEAKALLGDKAMQDFIPKDLLESDVLKDVDQWTKGLSLDQSQLKDLGNLPDLGSLKNLEDIPGLEMVDQYKDQLQEFLDPYQEELNQLKKLTEQYQNKFPGNMNPSALSDEMKAYLAQYRDQLLAAQKQLAALKKKYGSILSTQDLGSALKRKSLKEEPTKKRFILGGKFDIASYNPFALDLAFRVGYRFDKKFSVGLQGTYRKTFGQDNRLSFLSGSFHYAGFVNYGLLRSFFAYSEFSRSQVAPQDNIQEQNPNPWANSWLLGLGKDVYLGKHLKMQTLLLYNFLHEPAQAVYPKPWVIRFGLQWDLIVP